jgi:PTH1 family peptidyl-tRNA hydrolase
MCFIDLIKKTEVEKFLIVGLGNIGAEYANTRHNIGFDVVDAFAKKHGGSWQLGRLAEVCNIKLKGRPVTLIKPTTYMNLSGKAFAYWMNQEKITVNKTLTIVDDLALPLEKIRVRPTGSDAGHNGLKDIQATLGSDAYPKLRFGIGNEFSKGRQVDFVLGKWLPNEQPVVWQKIDACVEVIEHFILVGIDATMSKYNKSNFVV